MGNFDKKVDAYVARSAPFAQPILEHLRQLVHTACPDVEETIKWGFPHFLYKGILCSMAAFKAHCTFGFWKGAAMTDPKKVMRVVGKTSMGHFERITSVDDLPSDKILLAYIKEAMRLNDDDIKVEKAKASKKITDVAVPVDLLKELKKNKAAKATFESFSNSHKREYIEWIAEAKTEQTREKRLATALEWMAEGKIRNWKYVRK